MAETIPHCRRREKYLPRTRGGTTSAIQLTHAGLPNAPAACITNISASTIPIARGAAAGPYQLIISTGAAAMTNHISRCVYRLFRKIDLRWPVRSISRLAGIDTSDAMNGSAAISPYWNGVAPSALANIVSGAPPVEFIQTDPNTHPSVTTPSDLRTGQAGAASPSSGKKPAERTGRIEPTTE